MWNTGEVYTVELYARVRRAVVVEKMSEREAARQFGLSRETVRKMLRYSVPPGYRRQQPARRPKLDAWTGAIDRILEDDKARHKKQRHTAKRIFERLREEHGYSGGYTIVKDYVRLRKLSQREMFVPLEHPPGDAQADFGEALAVIDGVERKAHYLAVDLPQSDDCFVMAFPAETTEAFLEGHNHAFAYFGAGAALRHLGQVQRASAGRMPKAARAQTARPSTDHRGAIRHRPRDAAAVARRALRSLRQALNSSHFDVAGALQNQ